MAAPDPVGCWGADQLMRNTYGLPITVLTGPATDNQVGVDIILEHTGVKAFNAMSNPAALGDASIIAVGLGARAQLAGAA